MKYTASSMFAGVGGIDFAFKQAGFSMIWANEMDKKAIVTFKTNHPEIELFEGKVEDFHESDFPYVDVLTGGFPCFGAGELVLTNVGYREIQDIKPGDSVLTDKGRLKKVKSITVGEVFKETVDMKCQGVIPIRTTSDHPFKSISMSRKWNNHRRCDERVFSEARWKNVKNFKKDDFVCMPTISDAFNRFSITKEEAFVLGRYIADGHTAKNMKGKNKSRRNFNLILSIGKHKLEDFRSKIKTLHFGEYDHTKSCIRAIISSKRLVLIAEEICGVGSENKTFGEFLFLPKELLSAMLDGYLSGDGHFSDKYSCWSANTVSYKLALSIQRAVLLVYKTNSSIGLVSTPDKTLIEGRVVNQKDYYQIRFRTELRKGSKAIVLGEDLALRFNSVSMAKEKELVYNLEVEDDNSYTVSNVSVHNCQSFSLAGLQKGFADIGRGTLFFEIVRIAEHIKPRAIMLENVKNLVHHDKGNTMKIILDQLSNLGYLVKHQVLAGDVHGNVPQGRERIFIVCFKDKSDFDGFKFPEPIPLMVSPSNLIQATAPEKYYYKNTKYYDMLLEEMTDFDAVYQLRRKYVRKNMSGVCPTLTANAGKGGHNVPLIWDEVDIRKLTPREMFRFQGFDDSFILPDGMADSHLYCQAGNSVVVPVVERIAKAILKSFSQTDSL